MCRNLKKKKRQTCVAGRSANYVFFVCFLSKRSANYSHACILYTRIEAQNRRIGLYPPPYRPKLKPSRIPCIAEQQSRRTGRKRQQLREPEAQHNTLLAHVQLRPSEIVHIDDADSSPRMASP
jgi:hypothetical protein